MKNLSIDNLRTLVTIVDMNGFAKAGELLGKSQPAVSLQIKKLESQLNCQLFQKQGQRQVPTEAGMQLYEMSKTLLNENDKIVQRFNKTPLEGKLHLGIPSEFATTLLPNIIGTFNHTHPKVSLEVTSALSAELLVQHQHAPFDLLLFIALSDSQQKYASSLEDDLVWVGAAGHQYTADNLNLIMAPEGCRYRERAITRLNRSKLNWALSYTTSDITGISSAIKEGLGVTALARSTVPEDLAIIDADFLPSLGTITINLMCHRTSVAAQTLHDYIYERLLVRTKK